jgi:hypothetical protein
VWKRVFVGGVIPEDWVDSSGGSLPHRRHQRGSTEDRDGSLDVVGKDVEAHFRAYIPQPSHSEVISAHPIFESTEDMLDNAAPDPHRVR